MKRLQRFSGMHQSGGEFLKLLKFLGFLKFFEFFKLFRQMQKSAETVIERGISRKIRTRKQKKLWNVLKFLLKFLVLSIPLHFLIWIDFDAAYLQALVAKIVEFMLHASGIGAVREGSVIYSATKTGDLTVKIIKDCVGWKSILALFGLMFASPGNSPSSLKAKAIGFILRAPLVFAANIFRIYSTIAITVITGLSSWKPVHEFLWEVGLMAVVILIWVQWLRSAEKKRRLMKN